MVVLSALENSHESSETNIVNGTRWTKHIAHVGRYEFGPTLETCKDQVKNA